jgi:S1-C subfamily serine protease
LVPLVKKVKPAVGTVVDPNSGSGSGFAVKLSRNQKKQLGDGVIVTNAHVAGESQSFDFHFAGGFDVKAVPLLVDEAADIAFLKIDESPKVSLPLRTSQPDLGESVVAIGSPYGFECSVSAGIVSGLERSIEGGSGSKVLGDMIQTDAFITNGNSGGPLLDMTGRVVGMNTVGIDGSGKGNWLNFAVPAAVIESHLCELAEFGDGVVKRAGIGAALKQHTFEPLEQRKWNRRTAVRIDRINDLHGPAAKAKLKEGDVVIRFNNKEVDHYHDLQISLNRWTIGAECLIEVVRDGNRVELSVVPREKP